MNDCTMVPGQACPMSPCPGRGDPAYCRNLAGLSAWRRLTIEDQSRRLGPSRLAIDPVVRDRVNACAFRGPVLPLSEQDDCGCRGQELSECRAGRGVQPGRVTLRDCLTCQGGEPF